MRIEYLVDFPQHLDQLADWHFNEWAYLHPNDASIERTRKELTSCLGKRRVDVCFIALDGDTLLGSASLLGQDMETHPELTPWLASVFVSPEHRRRGIGSALCRRVMEEAAAIGIPAMYLYTPDQEPLYARLGWETVERVDYNGTEVVVMRFTPAAD